MATMMQKVLAILCRWFPAIVRKAPAAAAELPERSERVAQAQSVVDQAGSSSPPDLVFSGSQPSDHPDVVWPDWRP